MHSSESIRVADARFGSVRCRMGCARCDLGLIGHVGQKKRRQKAAKKGPKSGPKSKTRRKRENA
jgi:sulfite reductase beta subunit-like hemoprotein